MSLERNVRVEVIGVNPPCPRCEATWKNVENAVLTVKLEGIEATVNKLDIMSKDVIQEYGAVVSPVVVVDGKVRIMGRVPDSNEIVKLLREIAK